MEKVNKEYGRKKKFCKKYCFEFAGREFKRKFRKAGKCSQLCMKYKNGAREFRRRLKRGLAMKIH